MKNSTKRIIFSISVIIVLTSYATIRYVLFKNIPISEFPMYILNKSISWAAVCFISFSYIISTLNKLNVNISKFLLESRKFYGLLGFALSVIHVFISIIYLNPNYYEKFYNNLNILTTQHQISLLFGIIALVILTGTFLNSYKSEEEKKTENWRKKQNIGYLALISVFIHLAVMGFEGWLNLKSWPNGLPPITLLAAIVVSTTLIFRVYYFLKRKLS